MVSFIEKERRALIKGDRRPRRRILQQPQQNFQRRLTPPQQNQNLFQSGSYPTPTESVMDVLFGGEGEREMGKQQAIFPQLQTSDVGDIISSVQNEMFSSNQQPKQRYVYRRRRR